MHEWKEFMLVLGLLLTRAISCQHVSNNNDTYDEVDGNNGAGLTHVAPRDKSIEHYDDDHSDSKVERENSDESGSNEHVIQYTSEVTVSPSTITTRHMGSTNVLGDNRAVNIFNHPLPGEAVWGSWANRGIDVIPTGGHQQQRPPQDANNFNSQNPINTEQRPQQRSSTSAQVDCPASCGKPEGSSKCLCFDKRTQADSWQEALANFADLTDHEQKPADDNPCRRYILESLFNQNAISQSVRNSLMANDHSPTPKASDCEKYQQQAKAESEYDRETVRLARLAGLCLARVDGRRATRYERGSLTIPPMPRVVSRRDIVHELFRNKRATSDIGLYDVTVGQRYKISCVQKGDIASERDEEVSLCTRCWAWRKLPDQYYPKFINEVVCEKNSSQCLGEFGKCSEQTRQIDIFEKTNVGDYEPVSISVSTCCDCGVSANSGLKHFISL